MTGKAALASVVVAVAAATYGDISTEFVMYQPEVVAGSDPLVPDFNDGSYWTVEMWVTVPEDDDWLYTLAWAFLRGGFFFEHPLGGDIPADPDLFDEYPALEWDSYYASTGGDSDFGFAGDVVNERIYREALWFDTPPNGGAGDFLLARYTLKQTCPSEFAPLLIEGNHSSMNSPLTGFRGPFLTAFRPAWDLDEDERVDQADLGILLAAYGSTPDDPEWDCRADIDADYDVDQSDLGLLLAHWGEGCP